MNFHPLAEIFPLMQDSDFDRLCDDIRENGLIEEIRTFENQIIDGRNRFLACQSVGIEPRFREYQGHHLIQFVVSLNLHRRHLSESQRAMVAARLADVKQGARTDILPIGGMLSQTSAAEILNVSVRSVSRAKEVIDNTVSEVIEAVDSGEISVAAGARIAALPKTKQKRMIRRGVDGLKKLAARLTEKKTIAAVRRNKVVCLLCNPELPFTEDEFKAHLVKLLARAPVNFARYIKGTLDEIEEFAMVGDIDDAYDKILAAIDAGFQTKAEIKQQTRLDAVILDAGLAYLLEYRTIRITFQEGKHEKARGARKPLYVRVIKAKTETYKPDLLDDDLDDDFDADDEFSHYFDESADLRNFLK